MAILEDKYNSSSDLSTNIDMLISDIEPEEKINLDAWWFENYSYYKTGILLVSSFLFSFLTFYYLYENFWNNGFFGGLGFLASIIITIVVSFITVDIFVVSKEFDDQHRFIDMGKNIDLFRAIENRPELLSKMKEILNIRPRLTVYEFDTLVGLVKQGNIQYQNQRLVELIDKKITYTKNKRNSHVNSHTDMLEDDYND